MTQTLSSVKFTMQVIGLIKIIIFIILTQLKNITFNRQEKVVFRNVRNHQLNRSDVTLLFILNAAEGRVQSLNVRNRARVNTTKYILWHFKIRCKKLFLQALFFTY